MSWKKVRLWSSAESDLDDFRLVAEPLRSGVVVMADAGSFYDSARWHDGRHRVHVPEEGDVPRPFEVTNKGPSGGTNDDGKAEAEPVDPWTTEDPWSRGEDENASRCSGGSERWQSGHSAWGPRWAEADGRWENWRHGNWRRQPDGNGWQRTWSNGDTWGLASTGSHVGSGSGLPGGSERVHLGGGDSELRDGRADGGEYDGGARLASQLAASQSLKVMDAPSFAKTSPAVRGTPDESVGEKGPSEKLVVPAFNGAIADGDDDLGASARSYLRQVAAWMKMTRSPKSKQGLILYQHLTGKAWVEAEGLDIERLASEQGVEYYLEWVRDRYLDVQVTQVGRSLSEFFRKLRKRPGQSIRDYVGEYDRAHARLIECGCRLPDLAAAWVFVDRMGLEESAELNLLASVGNVYDLKRLQQAAIVQDRALRKPWESQRTSTTARNDDKGKREWWGRKTPHSALLAGVDEGEEDDGRSTIVGDNESEAVPEGIAEELYNAYMTCESAKLKYRDQLKMRGTNSEALKEVAAERLRAAKQKSFCAGCRRRGHWHRDAECPLNQGRAKSPSAGERGGGAGQGDGQTKTSYQCHVVHVTWDIEKEKNGRRGQLDAITDTACSRTVAGAGWLDAYVAELDKIHEKPQIFHNDEHFRFGASRIFHSTHAAVVTFQLGQAVIEVKVAIVYGELPLLLSRPALAKLGMVLDVARNRASFAKVGVQDLALMYTNTGHPAIPLQPVPNPNPTKGVEDWRDCELKIHMSDAQYMEGCSGLPFGLGRSVGQPISILHNVFTADQIPVAQPEVPKNELFFPKKVGVCVKNMLLGDTLNVETFISWWKGTNISNDFWVEGGSVLARIHVIPRKNFFNPGAWETQSEDHKIALLDQLGAIRSTSGISCKTYRDLTPVHGPWKTHADCGHYPVLWIGRTMFARRLGHDQPSSGTTTGNCLRDWKDRSSHGCNHEGQSSTQGKADWIPGNHGHEGASLRATRRSGEHSGDGNGESKIRHRVHFVDGVDRRPGDHGRDPVPRNAPRDTTRSTRPTSTSLDGAVDGKGLQGKDMIHRKSLDELDNTIPQKSHNATNSTILQELHVEPYDTIHQKSHNMTNGTILQELPTEPYDMIHRKSLDELDNTDSQKSHNVTNGTILQELHVESYDMIHRRSPGESDNTVVDNINLKELFDESDDKFPQEIGAVSHDEEKLHFDSDQCIGSEDEAPSVCTEGEAQMAQSFSVCEVLADEVRCTVDVKESPVMGDPSSLKYMLVWDVLGKSLRRRDTR